MVPQEKVKQFYRESVEGLTNHIAVHDCIKQIRVLSKVRDELGLLY